MLEFSSKSLTHTKETKESLIGVHILEERRISNESRGDKNPLMNFSQNT